MRQKPARLLYAFRQTSSPLWELSEMAVARGRARQDGCDCLVVLALTTTRTSTPSGPGEAMTRLAPRADPTPAAG